MSELEATLPYDDLVVHVLPISLDFVGTPFNSVGVSEVMSNRKAMKLLRRGLEQGSR